MPARAHIEVVGQQNEKLTVAGWMFVPARPIDRFRLVINGTAVLEGPPRQRPDVLAAFPRVPSALNSEFHFEATLPSASMRDWVDIEIVGVTGGAEIGRTGTLFRVGFADGMPNPTPEMMHRVSNISDSAAFWMGGLEYYGILSKSIERHRGGMVPRRILDWGCGCGRIAAFFLKYSGMSEVCGCDIDGRAVQWCDEHLKPGKFSTSQPYPPLQYGKESFDVVFGSSVFTHLDRELQRDWLVELRRILAPGGLLLVSTQGELAALLTAPERAVNEMKRHGISDYLVKDTFDGVAPPKYYREVYQTREYTLNEWSKILPVLEHIEAGMGNFQDLVILRKPDGRRG
ncbi:MAG: class I SAM-dependent methyltransferase [Planctomycetes bacterium]|nr:class I SAM-dependent methyltransferase [Planctomycetota bacterium]MBI3845833.1 class I SAM-dependent methyltransferase [Planctomycetota bacterium]